MKTRLHRTESETETRRDSPPIGRCASTHHAHKHKHTHTSRETSRQIYLIHISPIHPLRRQLVGCWLVTTLASLTDHHPHGNARAHAGPLDARVATPPPGRKRLTLSRAR